ncbi:ATP-binding protein [Aliidiomarina maris]|uniref:histidine kinase n=1 Tax=Aliidiomarina maris TaxID=531312 RepID=A0A327WQT0_9GAMM|nr:ATP-binding protein [Aliidiomarina maris]MCL5051148.1 ATP-binding protein [Bacillota bacterium]RAJ94905.1 two-component system sensor histidine kinase CpxA [Aliidiomarina maris]RUO20494.1 hypothetical protein CWE07_12060 [Aliidiomarina maris]
MLDKLRVGTLGFKILGWFWLTLFISYLVASVAAYTFPVAPEQRSLPRKDRESIAAVANLLVEYLNTSDEYITKSRDDRFMDWAVYGLDGALIASTSELPQAGQEFLSAHDWQLGPIDVLTSHHVITGPQLVTQADGSDVLVLFWRERYPRLIDRIRSLPAWFPLGLALLATLTMSLLFYRSIVKPLQRITDGFASLACGKMDYRIGPHFRHDEFGTLYDNFDRMADQLDSLIKSQHRLSADISHELKTPLSRLQMALALARSAGPEQIDNYIDRAESEVEKLDELIKQLLQLAEIKSRPFDYGLEPLDVQSLLVELEDDARFEADALNLTYSQHIELSQPLMLNRRLCVMALENLVRNAFKYAKSEVSLHVYEQQGMAIFEVCDDGPGVEAQDLERISQPFYRSDQARGRDTGGVGLGLAIASQAACVHHGVLELNNAPGSGLCARLRIPLRATTRATTQKR